VISAATGENHERAVLKTLLGELDLEGVLIQADALHSQRPFSTPPVRVGEAFSKRSDEPIRRRCIARLPVDSGQHAGGDARHHGPAGDGDASARAQDVRKLSTTPLGRSALPPSFS
jgi:hypothetical protein